jgi:glutamine synthetase
MRIEAQTTVDMAIRQILPAVSKYCGDLCARADVKQRLFVARNAEMDLITKLSEGIDQLYIACDELKKTLLDVPSTSDEGSAYYYRVVSPAMKKVRAIADGLEVITDKSYWPFPTYSDILFY